MNNTFRVHVQSFEILQEIEGAHTPADFRSLLDAMEYGDASGLGESELREMCVMSLQDRKPAEAAELVLKHDLGDRLNEGQIRNLASDMVEEKLWEHHADMSLHERFFSVGSLLYEAFPQDYPEPDAVRATLEVVATNEEAKETLAEPLHESLLVRLLADGMDDSAVLQRLFGEQLHGNSFPEADKIVWIVQTESLAADRMQIEVVSSGYWLDSLRDTKAFDSAAYRDRE